jgi:hypothetical protein
MLGMPLDGLNSWQDVIDSSAKPSPHPQPQSHTAQLDDMKTLYSPSAPASRSIEHPIRTLSTMTTRKYGSSPTCPHPASQMSSTHENRPTGLKAKVMQVDKPTWMNVFSVDHKPSIATVKEVPITLLGYTFRDPARARDILVSQNPIHRLPLYLVPVS